MKNTLIKVLSVTLLGVLCVTSIYGDMPLEMKREAMIQYAPEWKGERFPDGRPKVSDSIIERMKLVDIEAACVVLRNEGYDYQFEDGWEHVHPGGVLCGRAMTVM